MTLAGGESASHHTAVAHGQAFSGAVGKCCPQQNKPLGSKHCGPHPQPMQLCHVSSCNSKARILFVSLHPKCFLFFDVLNGMLMLCSVPQRNLVHACMYV